MNKNEHPEFMVEEEPNGDINILIRNDIMEEFEQEAQEKHTSAEHIFKQGIKDFVDKKHK